VGGFSSVAYPRLFPAGGLILLALLLLMTLSSELDIMALGEDTARSLGLAAHKMRTVFWVWLLCWPVLLSALQDCWGLLV
jgi:iron complex transport system permease protein